MTKNSCITGGQGEELYLVHEIAPQNATVQQEDAVAQLTRELEALAYSISHDVRAPLRAINGYVQILHEDYDQVLDDEGRRMLSIITYNAGKMGSLIDNLLSLSRTARRELKRTEVKLYELVEGAILEINKITNHEAEIKIDTPDSIYCDYGLMNQVMVHLIGNAIKYSSKADAPLIEIRSRLADQSVVCSISDNGVGFDMKHSDKLFGVFQRLHTAEEFDGAGIGLAIVQRIISRHGGKVWAEAKPGEGATFSFSVPAKA
jgi:light-regulated signal transduction histidine kinase (bacteriophytochrome)